MDKRHTLTLQDVLLTLKAYQSAESAFSPSSYNYWQRRINAVEEAIAKEAELEDELATLRSERH